MNRTFYTCGRYTQCCIGKYNKKANRLENNVHTFSVSLYALKCNVDDLLVLVLFMNSSVTVNAMLGEHGSNLKS